MRYSKKHVNEIIDQVVKAFEEVNGLSYEEEKAVDLIKEEHLLIDRRISSLPEYKTEVVRDFMETSLSYKELMKKYHCSMRTVKALLLKCAENDERVYDEIELRRH